MGKTLLLADDSVTIQKVVGISFASEDIAITTVDNGDDAVVRAREMRPDVILADVVMPGKSGYEVCETVKADPELRHVPVLLLTGTFETFDEERASRAGAAGHVAKPFEAQTLVDRVKELLSQAPAAAAPAPPLETPAADGATSGTENAFDFFDDAAAEAAPAAAAAAAPEPALERAEFDLDGPDAAFAFGEEDLESSELTPPPETPSQPVAHTIAILPDDTSPDAEPEGFATPEPPAPIRPEVLAPPPMAGEPPPLTTNPPPVPSASAASEGFDFEFESVASTRAPAPEPAARDSLDGDLAESTLLDPNGDSAYDVSSSDLGDLAVPAPDPAPGSATQLLDESLTPPPRDEIPVPEPPPAPAPAVDFAVPEPMADLGNDPVMEMLAADPVDDGPVTPAADFVEEMPTAAPTRSADPMEFAQPEVPAPPAPQAAPEPEPAIWPEEPLEPETMAPAPAMPEPAPMEIEPIAELPQEIATPAEEPQIPDDALAQIAPALREQLHETLEKIAWEAFGQVTETVVEQAVERLEKIAWEVVPKLAETLIQEELRKLKAR